MSRRHNALSYVVFFTVALIGALAAQYWGGAYTSDLHWPDEASHYINGLLIHDYVAAGLPQSPLRYAAHFYANYPKVSIGHWPPFFYLIEAAFFFVFGTATTTAIFLEGIFAALLAASVGFAAWRRFGRLAGVMATILVVAAPTVRSGIEGVLLDVPVALFSFLATLSWARYLDKPSWRPSLWFGLWASAAILTKGNGIFLALVPPVALLATRTWSSVCRGDFWLPLPIVGMLTVPWYIATYKMSADGFNYSWGFHFVATAAPIYGWYVLGLIGLPGLLIAVLGSAAVFQRPWPSDTKALGISTFSSAIAGIVFHCIVPVAIEPRYLVPLVPDLAILVVFGLYATSLAWPALRLAVTVACALTVVAGESAPRVKSDHGLGAAARVVLADSHRNPFVLVGSTPGGEGAVTAEIAAHDRDRREFILRGFKVLASGNFMGTVYRPRFSDAPAVQQWIQQAGVGWVVIDTSSNSLDWAHNRQLLDITEDLPSTWHLAARLARPTGTILVYRVAQHGGQRISPASLIRELRPHVPH